MNKFKDTLIILNTEEIHQRFSINSYAVNLFPKGKYKKICYKNWLYYKYFWTFKYANVDTDLTFMLADVYLLGVTFRTEIFIEW